MGESDVSIEEVKESPSSSASWKPSKAAKAKQAKLRAKAERQAKVGAT